MIALCAVDVTKSSNILCRQMIPLKDIQFVLSQPHATIDLKAQYVKVLDEAYIQSRYCATTDLLGYISRTARPDEQPRPETWKIVKKLTDDVRDMVSNFSLGYASYPIRHRRPPSTLPPFCPSASC